MKNNNLGNTRNEVNFLNNEIIKNKAAALALDEFYYNDIYISWVLNYRIEINNFISNNKTLIDGWFNNKNKITEKEIFLDMLNFLNTVTFKKEHTKDSHFKFSDFEINFSFLRKYKSVKDSKEIENIWSTAKEMSVGVCDSSLNSRDQSNLTTNNLNEKEKRKFDFFNLFKFHQIALSFIKDEDFRKELIFDNLNELSKNKDIKSEFLIKNEFKSQNNILNLSR